MKTKLTALLICITMLSTLFMGCDTTESTANGASQAEPAVSEETAAAPEQTTEEAPAEDAEASAPAEEPEEVLAATYPLVEESSTCLLYTSLLDHEPGF